MEEWNKAIKPSENICPEKYCWFWGKTKYVEGKRYTEYKCRESYRDLKDVDCVRRPQYQTPAIDWYEPCEPELRRDGLPDDYFMGSSQRKTL